MATWTNNAWIHHRNGYNITDLVTTTAISRSKANDKMKISKDKITQAVGDRIEPANSERLVRLGLQNANDKKEEVMKSLTKTLEQQNNGKALTTALNSKHK